MAINDDEWATAGTILDDLNSSENPVTENAPITGSTLFHMGSKIYLKENKKDELSEKLSEIEINFGLAVKLERI